MKNDKKMVEQITSMDVDFAQWYTDICMGLLSGLASRGRGMASAIC